MPGVLRRHACVRRFNLPERETDWPTKEGIRVADMMRRRLLIITAAAAVAGCSVLFDPNRTQCSTAADCTGRGPAFAGTVCVDSFCQAPADPVWGCAANSAATAADAGRFQASLRLVDGVTQRPLAGVLAQLCRKLDIACANPLAGSVHSDATGLVAFDVEAGFDGYVLVTDPAVAPTLYFFNPPVAADVGPTLVALVSAPSMTLFAQQIGAALLPDRGTVILTGQDCQGDPAAGVTFAASTGDAMTVPFYFVGMLPTARAPSTDRSGLGGLANVPSGVATVSGTLATQGLRLGTLSLLVRPGAITYTQWVPVAN